MTEESVRGSGDDRPVAVLETDPDLVLVRIRGEVDMLTELEVRSVLGSALRAASDRPMVIDATEVEFFASTGATAVVQAFATGREQGVDVCLVIPPHGIARRSFEIMGLTALIPTYDTVAAARRGQVDEGSSAGRDRPDACTSAGSGRPAPSRCPDA